MQWTNVLVRIAQHLQQTGADPAHSVVLVPFAQLLPQARKQWAQLYPNSLLPRFETSTSWAQRLRPFVPDDNDIAWNAAADLLTAQRLLGQAGLADQAQALASRVYEAALQLAPVAASWPVSERGAWAVHMQQALQQQGSAAPLHYEQSIAAVALTWAAHSSYVTDVLFDVVSAEQLQALLVLPGIQRDLLVERLQTIWSEQCPDALCLLDWSFESGAQQAQPAYVHIAQHFEDQALRAAACVQQALERQQTPIALVDSDRALTRRICALLDVQGIAVRDETGWKLSTSHAASQLMSVLRACAPKARSDAVLAWLKLMDSTQVAGADSAKPVHTADIDSIEAHLRQHAYARWPSLPYWNTWQNAAGALAQQVEHWRQQLLPPRSLLQWLNDVRDTLQRTGQWEWLQSDPAGQAVLSSLHWQTGSASLHPPDKPWTLGEFTFWVSQVLEASKFHPTYVSHDALDKAVVLVPPGQLLGRPFAAVVLPGCDEKRLPAVPELSGLWTNAQRTLLGLADSAQAQQYQRRAWECALSYARVDLLYSHSEEGAEQQPSPLLLEWMQAAEPNLRRIQQGDDPRILRQLSAQPQGMPQAQGKLLPVLRLSASSYAALRACPYQFFALHQLRLRQAPELLETVEKRDFGIWLHRTLQIFHESLLSDGHQAPDLSVSELVFRLDEAATQAQQTFDPADFLPYQLSWPQMRDGYIRWLLADYTDEKMQFVQGEVRCERALSEALQPTGEDTARLDWPVHIVGTIDRMDRFMGRAQNAQANWRLLDYKTESDLKTKARIRQDGEDTQLSFYAALLGFADVRVAYLNIQENGTVKLYEQHDAFNLGQQLLQGVAQDLQRIASGNPLPALGQGKTCDYCAARGLCRRDFWQESV